MNDSGIVARHQVRSAVKSLSRRFGLWFAQRNCVSAFHRPPLVSPEATREISGAASEQQRNIDPAVACEIEEATGDDLVDRKLVTGSRISGRARRNYPSRKCRARSRTADRENTVSLETHSAAAERPLKRRCIDGIANHSVGSFEREKVHRASRRNAGGARTLSPAILHG